MKKLSTFEIKWLRIFAKNIPKELIEKYVIDTGSYIWHIFSFKLISPDLFLEGDVARAAFNIVNSDKENAKYYLPFPQNESHYPKFISPPSAKDLETFTEVYVVASDDSWTYIVTHEKDMCGPYFFKNPHISNSSSTN